MSILIIKKEYDLFLQEELSKRGFFVVVHSLNNNTSLLEKVDYFFRLIGHVYKCRIVFLDDISFFGLTSFLFSKFFFKKFILNIDAKILIFNKISKIKKMILTNADQIIVPTKYLQRIVLNLKPKKAKVKVIGGYFDPHPIHLESKEDLRKRLDFDGMLALTITSFRKDQGLESVIRVIKKLTEENCDIKLLIFGSGKNISFFKDMIVNLGLTDNVMIIEDYDFSMFRKYMKASDIFIVNDKQEYISRDILEGMACGTPMVLTNTISYGEFFQDGKEVILSQYNDEEAIKTAILTILKMSGQGDGMSEKLIKKSSSFTKDKYVIGLSEVFSKYE